MVAHRTRFPVRFNELDPYDHVNHAVYVTWLEVGRVVALDDIGLGLDTLKTDGYQFVVTAIDVRFRRAATAGDVVEVVTGIATFGRASTVWRQRIERGDDVLVTADVTVGVTNAAGRPTKPPVHVMEGLRALALEDQTAT